MALSPRASWALILGGLGAAAAGVYYLRRQQLGLGYNNDKLIRKLADAAPIVSVKKSGGMTVTHRRSKFMPIEQRVRSIQDMVFEGISKGEMRKLALGITRHCPERDKKCEAEAVYKYVKKNVRYTGDIAPVLMPDGNVEAIDLYQRGDRTLEFGGGDCDDQAALNATLLSLNGIPARLRVTAETKGGDWSHIYATGEISPGKWVALDTTLPGSNNFDREVRFGRSIDFVA